MLEVDERSSLKVYKYLTPDILICNNIMRDSLKRNAHTEFICYILNKQLPSSTKVVLNADDLICSGLFPNNKDRTYFGVSADRPENGAATERCATSFTARNAAQNSKRNMSDTIISEDIIVPPAALLRRNPIMT